jgi:hypothetical protein
MSTMPTAPTIPDVVGIAELAEKFSRPGKKVSPQLAHKWSLSKRFPDPVIEVAAGRLWLTSDIDAWVEEFRPDLAD